MAKVGFAACSTLTDGGCCRDPGRLLPLRTSPGVSWVNEEPEDAALCWRDGALAREASSFTGGAGASAAGVSTASTPNGPSGPIESSSVSSVVDCVRLPYRRGARDLEVAGLTDKLLSLLLVGAGGGEESRVGSAGVGVSSAAWARVWVEGEREGTSVVLMSILVVLSYILMSALKGMERCTIPW